MARYQFSIYTFGPAADGPIRMGNGTDLVAHPGSSRGVLGIGEAFRYTGGAATTVIVQDDDRFASDGSADPQPAGTPAAGNQILADDPVNPVAWRGQPLQPECRITVRIDGGPAPAAVADMFVVRIGPNAGLSAPPGNLGIVSVLPLDAAVTYTVVSLTDQETPASLRAYVSPDGQTVGDRADIDQVEWDALSCFTAGTLIDTPDGLRPVEDLRPGDLVTTLSNGSQRLRWVGHRHVTAAALLALPALRPVEFDTGSIGNSRPLRVSRQHRLLLNDWRAQVYFGEDEVLIAARALVNGRTIRDVTPASGVTYIHLLFDRHEVILAEGALTESLHPGEIALGGLDAAQQQEIEALFPGLALAMRPSAFPIVRPSEACVARLAS